MGVVQLSGLMAASEAAAETWLWLMLGQELTAGVEGGRRRSMAVCIGCPPDGLPTCSASSPAQVVLMNQVTTRVHEDVAKLVPALGT